MDMDVLSYCVFLWDPTLIFGGDFSCARTLGGSSDMPPSGFLRFLQLALLHFMLPGQGDCKLRRDPAVHTGC